MPDKKPHEFPLAPQLYAGTQLYTQHLNPVALPGEFRYDILALYSFMASEYKINPPSINTTPVGYIPAGSGNPATDYNSIIIASDDSQWFIDGEGRSFLLRAKEYFETLGAVNTEKVVNTPLPDPGTYSATQINQMLSLYSGGMRLFYSSNYTINFAQNKLEFPFDRGGETAHLIFKKLFY